MLSQAALDQIEKEAAKYPSDKRASALMAALRIAQEEHGHLTNPLIDHVADVVGVPPMRAFEVATFYSMYEHKPCGQTQIKVCTTNDRSFVLNGKGSPFSRTDKTSTV